MTAAQIDAAVDSAFAVGMHQWDAEIRPCAHWVAERTLQGVLEIGTLHGGTMTLWGAICAGPHASIDLPDGPFGGAAHQYGVQKSLKRNRWLADQLPNFYGFLGDSHDRELCARVQQTVGMVDLLFIDGDHAYPGVKQDWIMYRPLVRPGGIVLFHDISATDVHSQAGCEVDRLWEEIKSEFVTVEWISGGAWGGIGAVVLP